MMRKILAMSLVLIILLAFTACGGEQLPMAQEIVDSAVQALNDVVSYQFETTSTMGVSGEAEGEVIEGSETMNQSGTLDLANWQMHMVLTQHGVMTGADDIDMTQEAYLIDDMVYVMTETSDTGITWMKTAIPAGYWERMNLIGLQTELLETAEIEVIGSEKAGGVDCYVLEATPDKEKLWQLFMQQLGITNNTMPDISPELLNEMLQSYSAKQWVAKDSYLLMKVEVEMSMELTPEIMGSPEGEGEATIHILVTMLVHDYNQPVSIELPPEAEEAIEIPLDF
jgi:outer membrane lipoprotein-sorting protein